MRQVLKAARLIDGSGAQPLSDACVHVDEQGLISYAGPVRTAPPAHGADLVELGDRTLLPGLIDCHAHPVSFGVRRSQPWADQVLVLEAVERLRRALLTGVTTIRNTGSPRYTAYALKEALASGAIAGPRLLIAGPIICPTGGHGFLGGGEADGPDGVRVASRDRFKHGASFLKLTATGGSTPGTVRWLANYTVEELAAAAEDAAAHASYATVHVHGTQGIVRCLDAGIQMLEHATFVQSDNLEHFDRDIALRMRDQDVAVVPTVQVNGRWVETGPGTAVGLSREALDEWRARYTALPCDLAPFPPLDRLPESEVAQWERRIESFRRRVELVGQLYEAGVVVLVGSDGGGRPAPIDDLAQGLQLHVRAGIPAIQVLTSATGLAAQRLGIADVTGALKAGKEADVIAAPGNPLEDMQVMERVDFVMRAGKVVRQPCP
jgi:imidazolonepropionase-like amidohydrolase